MSIDARPAINYELTAADMETYHIDVSPPPPPGVPPLCACNPDEKGSFFNTIGGRAEQCANGENPLIVDEKGYKSIWDPGLRRRALIDTRINEQGEVVPQPAEWKYFGEAVGYGWACSMTDSSSVYYVWASKLDSTTISTISADEQPLPTETPTPAPSPTPTQTPAEVVFVIPTGTAPPTGVVGEQASEGMSQEETDLINTFVIGLATAMGFLGFAGMEVWYTNKNGKPMMVDLTKKTAKVAIKQTGELAKTAKAIKKDIKNSQIRRRRF